VPPTAIAVAAAAPVVIVPPIGVFLVDVCGRAHGGTPG